MSTPTTDPIDTAADTTAASDVNIRNRSRRLRLFAPAFVLVAILGYTSLHQVWYSATMPPTTVLGVSGVTAHAQLTGAGLTALDSTPTPVSQGSFTTNPQITSHMGILAPVFWLLVAALLGVAASLMASLLASIGALASAYFAWQSLLALRAQMEVSRTLGAFTLTRGVGQQRLWLALTLMVALTALVGLQAALVRHQSRLLEKKLHPKEASTFGGLAGLGGGILGKLLFGANENSEEAAQMAGSHMTDHL